MPTAAPKNVRPTLLADAAWALALVAALAVLCVVDVAAWGITGSGATSSLTFPSLPANESNADGTPAAGPLAPLRIGIAPQAPEFDYVGRLVSEQSGGGPVTPIPLDSLRSTAELDRFDVLFLASSGAPLEWLTAQSGASGRDGQPLFRLNDEVLKQVDEQLRGWVERGGTLYASDQHWRLVARAFPEVRDVAADVPGELQVLTAEVVEPGLALEVGERVELHFDQADWRPAACLPDKVTTLLRGAYRRQDGKTATLPLAVSFRHGKGLVLYSALTAPPKPKGDATQIVRYLAAQALLAPTEARIRATLSAAGFTPLRSTIVRLNSSAAPVRQTIDITTSGPLEFVIGPVHAAARLRLEISGPGAPSLIREGSGILAIGVPQAAAGAWSYTLTLADAVEGGVPVAVVIAGKRP